eukprot:scaffold4937_cov30-Tisochrysis_lutea.AAC.1
MRSLQQPASPRKCKSSSIGAMGAVRGVGRGECECAVPGASAALAALVPVCFATKFILSSA